MNDETHDDDEQQPAPTATPDGGLLANEHDVDKLGEDVAKLQAGLAQRGVAVDLNRLDLNNIKPRVEAIAACRMLIAKGICTEAEMATFCNQEFKAILMAVLQIVEEQQLANRGPQVDQIITPESTGKIQTVRPKLAVVRH